MTLAPLKREDGITLIEILVGLVTGMVVSLAALALVDTSLHLYSTVTDRLDAAQTGQSAMSYIEQTLQSGCSGLKNNGSWVVPVQSANSSMGISTGSDNTHLVVVSSPGPSAAPAYAGTGETVPEALLHVITLSATTNGTLTDTTYAIASATATSVTFSTTAKATHTIATGISQVGTTPIFQYYGYSGTQLSSTPFTTPLSSSDASNSAEVLITFTVAPSSGSTKSTRQAVEQDAVVLTLSSAGASPTTGPCT